MAGLPLRTSAFNVSDIGTLFQPTSGLITVAVQRSSPYNVPHSFRLDFTLNRARLTVTDSGSTGSSASHKIFTFTQGGIVANACRQDYTAFAEGSALTTGAGDAAFVMGLGSVAANAGDAALTSTEVDFGAVTGTITNSGGTGSGTKFSATAAVFDGTTTATDVYVNWSGSAATIDANSTIDVTGTISIWCSFLGDD